jgi:hypothetical protein
MLAEQAFTVYLCRGGAVGQRMEQPEKTPEVNFVFLTAGLYSAILLSWASVEDGGNRALEILLRVRRRVICPGKCNHLRSGPDSESSLVLAVTATEAEFGKPQ